jgi:hypothetical protein
MLKERASPPPLNLTAHLFPPPHLTLDLLYQINPIRQDEARYRCRPCLVSNNPDALPSIGGNILMSPHGSAGGFRDRWRFDCSWKLAKMIAWDWIDPVVCRPIIRQYMLIREDWGFKRAKALPWGGCLGLQILLHIRACSAILLQTATSFTVSTLFLLLLPI